MHHFACNMIVGDDRDEYGSNSEDGDDATPRVLHLQILVRELN